MAKHLLFTGLAAAIAAAIFVVDRQSVGIAAPDVSPAILGPPDQIYAAGIVEGATPDVELRSEISGRVAAVLVANDQWVEVEDVLILLDDRQYVQQLAARKAALDLARAQLERLVNGARPSELDEAKSLYLAKRARLEQAENTLGRIVALRRHDAVSQQESDDQRSLVSALTGEVAAARARLEQLESPPRQDALREAQARVAAAEADYELAQVLLGKTRIRAPLAGRVLEVQVEPGELLGPEAPRPAMTLADTSRLRVRAYVEEIDAPRLATGMPASITADGLQGLTIVGSIESLSPRMSRKELSVGRSNELYDTKVREVLVAVEDAGELLLGLRVDVKFQAK